MKKKITAERTVKNVACGFRCLNCLEGIGIHDIVHEYDRDFCPYCSSDMLFEAQECLLCGKFYFASDLDSGYCEYCLVDMFTAEIAFDFLNEMNWFDVFMCEKVMDVTTPSDISDNFHQWLVDAYYKMAAENVDELDDLLWKFMHEDKDSWHTFANWLCATEEQYIDFRYDDIEYFELYEG